MRTAVVEALTKVLESKKRDGAKSYPPVYEEILKLILENFFDEEGKYKKPSHLKEGMWNKLVELIIKVLIAAI